MKSYLGFVRIFFDIITCGFPYVAQII